ncbi:MAG: Conserved rane protein of unknown function [Rhodospirillales bacterium]|nr:Conserved rane protein of unknown function [Rhodospirillales bacterium]
MTGSIAALLTATIVFVGAHLVLSAHPIRGLLVARIGERPFTGLYSALVALPFIWMIAAYRAAPTDYLWIAPTGIKHLTLTIMIVATILAAASVSRNNPAVAGAPPPKLEDGPKGIFRITRHPFMWGVALWAITHLMASGDAASVIVFGGLATLALVGTLHSDSRKHRQYGPAWDIYARQSSHLPFLAIAQGRTHLVWSEIGWRPVILGAALYLVLLIGHEPVIGIAPVSIVSGIFG